LAQSEARKSELYAQPVGVLHVAVLSGSGHVELCRVGYEPAADSHAKAKAQATPHGVFLRKRWVVPKSASSTAGSSSSSRSSSSGDGPKAHPADVPFSRPGDGAAVAAVFSALEGSVGAGNTVDMEAAQAAAAAARAAPGTDSRTTTATVGSSAARPALGPALPSLLKAELTFVGASGPASVAVASECVAFPDDDDPEGPGGPFPRKLWVQLGAVKDKLAIQVQLVRLSPEGPYRLGDAFVSAPAPAE
jgi:hypothetical protein